MREGGLGGWDGLKDRRGRCLRVIGGEQKERGGEARGGQEGREEGEG